MTHFSRIDGNGVSQADPHTFEQNSGATKFGQISQNSRSALSHPPAGSLRGTAAKPSATQNSTLARLSSAPPPIPPRPPGFRSPVPPPVPPRPSQAQRLHQATAGRPEANDSQFAKVDIEGLQRQALEQNPASRQPLSNRTNGPEIQNSKPLRAEANYANDPKVDIRSLEPQASLNKTSGISLHRTGHVKKRQGASASTAPTSSAPQTPLKSALKSTQSAPKKTVRFADDLPNTQASASKPRAQMNHPAALQPGQNSHLSQSATPVAFTSAPSLPPLTNISRAEWKAAQRPAARRTEIGDMQSSAPWAKDAMEAPAYRHISTQQHRDDALYRLTGERPAGS